MPIHPITQAEQILEDKLVTQLIGLGYTQVAVTDEASMLANLKAQLEAFNGLTLTAGEFSKVLNHLNRKAGVFEKAKTLRDRMKLTKEDEGMSQRSLKLAGAGWGDCVYFVAVFKVIFV